MQVDQVRREHVHAKQLLKGSRFFARLFHQPVGGVVHDGAQAVGVALELLDKRQDAGFTGEVRLQGYGTALPERINAVALAAVCNDYRVTVIQQAFGAVQAYTLAGSGYQDRGGADAHARLGRKKKVGSATPRRGTRPVR